MTRISEMRPNPVNVLNFSVLATETTGPDLHLEARWSVSSMMSGQVNFITENGRRCGASGSPNTAHTEHITRNGTGFLLFLTDTEKSPNSTPTGEHITSRNYGGLKSYSK